MISHTSEGDNIVTNPLGKKLRAFFDSKGKDDASTVLTIVLDHSRLKDDIWMYHWVFDNDFEPMCACLANTALLLPLQRRNEVSNDQVLEYLEYVYPVVSICSKRVEYRDVVESVYTVYRGVSREMARTMLQRRVGES